MAFTITVLIALLEALAKYCPKFFDMIFPGIDTRIRQLDERITDALGSPTADCQCRGDPNGLRGDLRALKVARNIWKTKSTLKRVAAHLKLGKHTHGLESLSEGIDKLTDKVETLEKQVAAETSSPSDTLPMGTNGMPQPRHGPQTYSCSYRFEQKDYSHNTSTSLSFEMRVTM